MWQKLNNNSYWKNPNLILFWTQCILFEVIEQSIFTKCHKSSRASQLRFETVRVLGRPFVKRFTPWSRTVACLYVTLVYCGQTVGWIKMPLDMEVGLGPGHSAGDPAPPHGKGHNSPHFPAHVYCGETVAHLRYCWALSYLLYGDDPPTCRACGIPLTVKRILVEYTNLRDIREKYFTVSSATDLFKSTDNHTRPNL